ncbi:hypothetical protein [Streptomyces sp. XC 2026]|uniref:hypothetical protein n=1 Tax=Streptomyces sp. XC 2026 TaxID=2782004 RepID=UPI001907FB38|nr:hypothetical protein [Streptomyces sp. XC 2026]QQN79695.1 hypothetical protein IPZ77_21435 [Streptomyces sp. XC 2026]QQN80607.1 hypothetical protein IPZ77_26740 [Streptomyces sp. XC 2026]
MDAVVAAVAALRDPSLPGTPWTVQQIAVVLPLLCDGPSSMVVEATDIRWLAAVDEGAPLPD